MTSLRGWVPSRRTLGVRSAPVVWLVLAALGSGLGCDGDAPAGGGNVVSVGDGDRAENGRVAVEEAKLRGNIDGGALTVRIPVRSLLEERGRGKLRVKLLSVDGKVELDSQEVAYELDGEESATLTAPLAVPQGVKTQADWALLSLRIEDGAKDGLRVTRSMLHVVPLLDLRLEGPSTLRPEREGYYRVSVRDALDNAPLEDQAVTFEVLRGEDVVQTHEVKTEVTGDASLKLALDEPGDFTVRARMAPGSAPTAVTLADQVKVESGAGKLLLTTDKPIYQPGQLVYLRALSLGRDGNRPIADSETTFEIEDAKGNKIFKKVVRTSDFGVAATTFRLGSILNEGTFKLRALSKDSQSEKTISVSRYALPKFDVSLRTEEPWYTPGAEIVGAIDTRYFFGKPVQGAVTIEAYSLDVGTTLFQKTMGTLDAQGHYDFSLTLPAQLPGLPLEQGNAAVELRVTVTDSAGQKVVKSSLVTVSAAGASVVVVPESGALVPGVENQLLLFATDPLGAPLANAAVSISPPSGDELSATTDAYGQASLSFTPPASATTTRAFAASVTLPGGKTVRSTFDFSTQGGAEHLLLRTDKSVYQVGDEVRVDVTSTEAKGTVYVDWINDGQTVDMRTLTAEEGQASFTTTLDTSLTGSNRIEAYLVDSEGQIVRTGRTIFARTDAALNVEVSADRDVYAPGAKAKLTLSVTDEKGEPAVAALGLQIVDQAVFSLVDAKPGLLRSYFEIEDRLAQPQYELHAPAADLSSLLFQETAQKDAPARSAAQRKTAAALAAMKNTSLTGIQRASLGDVLVAVKGKLEPAYSAQRVELSPQVSAAVKAAAAVLKKRGCVPYSGCAGSGFFDELERELASSLIINDFWGSPMALSVGYDFLTLTSAGPDERAATADDAVATFPLVELMVDLDEGSPNEGEGSGFPPGAGGPVSGTGGSSSGGGGNQAPESESGPRVRRDFPETLYVNPSVITDERGRATLDVDMADSITEWRVSALASSADGRLGGTESGIKVFQDFFVDVSFPAALTRGDQVSFPIAVYNYLDEPQTVSLKLEPAPWYTALGVTETSVKLAAGQVLGVSFPVKVNDVGLQSLTVVAQGEQKADAVARTVRVVPDGKAFPRAFSGTIDQGSAEHTVTFPDSGVPGSQQLYLDLFPAFLSQAVQGMDSILAEPNGCFEQTTSSAWPNVLVTRYMKDTKQITPEIELKAEALMSTGYQRLLTFEHRGGGFSWFGEQDPAPFLSVTAFGIMEFSDMAQVLDVDQAMLDRTVAWMLSQQNSDGSFKGDMSEFFSFYTSTVRNTAFTAWALATAGETGGGVQSALDFVRRNLGPDNDPYTLALVANAFALAEPSDPLLTEVLERLNDAKVSDEQGVHWDSAGTQTNFYGGGDDAVVATTALVAHALLLTGSGGKTVEDALKFLTSKKDPAGNFGSTQATIWTLRTLLLSAKKGTSGAVGSLSVTVDGKPVQTISLTKAESDVMSRIDLTSLATTGEHQVSLAFTGSGKPSYNLVQSYHLPWAVAPQEEEGPLSIDVSYDKSELFVNDRVRATVTLENNENVTQNMVLLTLGIAPGFEVDTDDLQQYLASGAISRFETTGRQLILYLTKVLPGATQVFEYDLLARMPVTAVDGGAEAKLYYEPQKRTKSPARPLIVAAR